MFQKIRMQVVTGLVYAVMLGGAGTSAWAQSTEGDGNARRMYIENHIAKLRLEIVEMHREQELINSQIEGLAVERIAQIDRLDSYNISPASFENIMVLLQTQRIELIIEIAGLEARRKAVIKIQEANAQAEENRQLTLIGERMLANAQDSLARIIELNNAGSVPQSEVSKAEMAMMEAELRLAQTRRDVSGQSADQNDETTAIAVEYAERQARLSMVEKLLKQLIESRKIIERLPQIEREREALKSNVDSLNSKMERYEQSIKAQEVTLESIR